MKLISASPSPYARKVRIVLIEKGIPFDLENDIPWAAETIVPQFNPLEKLPILITDDGEGIYESRFIVEWLERRFPSPAMIPTDDDGYLACKKLELIADGVIDASLLYTRDTQDPHPDLEWRARQGRKIAGGIAEAARLIGDRPFALGGRFTLADAAIGTMLAAFEFADTVGWRMPESLWRERHPNLAPYLDALNERESFAQTRPVMFDFDFTRKG